MRCLVMAAGLAALATAALAALPASVTNLSSFLDYAKAQPDDSLFKSGPVAATEPVGK